MKILKELFEKSSLSRAPQSSENGCRRQPRKRSLLTPCASSGRRPCRPLGRSKTTPGGWFSLLHPARPSVAQCLWRFCAYYGCIQVILCPHRDFVDILIILRCRSGHPSHPPFVNRREELKSASSFVQLSFGIQFTHLKQSLNKSFSCCVLSRMLKAHISTNDCGFRSG